MKTTKFLFTAILSLAVGGFAWGQHMDQTGSQYNGNIYHTGGSVGIGTASPQELLHVNGDIRGGLTQGALRVQSGTGYLDLGSQNGNWCHITTDMGRYYFNGDMWTSTGLFGAYYNTDLSLFTSTTGPTPVTRMTIKYATGHVGIGTTSPNAQLVVNEDAIFNEVSGNNDFRIESDMFDDIFFVDASANAIGIGTQTAADLDNGYILNINGKARATEVKVYLQSNWADFVFDKNYDLPTLKEVERFISKNNHLPDVPSEKEVKKDGISLGAMDAILLQKIEELTLYIIEQEKRIAELENGQAK